MDKEDKRRYLIVGSVILEIVSPLLRKRLEDCFTSKGFGCLQDFINSLPVKHMLYHLRHKNSKCCVDTSNCVNQQSLPLNYSQWNMIYTAGSTKHNCHCKYTANHISLNDLDLTLLSLILLNCCSLSSNERTVISDLREFKNKYLSHNTDGAISETEYNILWTDLTSHVLQLDPSKQNHLVIIQNRPFDESLCQYYVTCLLDVHVILEKIDSKIDSTSAEIKTTIGNGNTEVMETICNGNTRLKTTIGNGNTELKTIIGNGNTELKTTIGNGNTEVMETIGTKTAELLATMGINNAVFMAKLEEVLRNKICQSCKMNIYEQDKQGRPLQPYTLGQSLFTLHHQIDLPSGVGAKLRGGILDIVMMDDGRLVMCLLLHMKLLICNTDGSRLDSIDVQSQPSCVTVVNNSTVAITLVLQKCIDMYDINNKIKFKSISVPGMLCGRWSGIATINNKLVVGGDNCLLIIDHQTGEVVQTIQTESQPGSLQGSHDRIFYGEYNDNNNLYLYSFNEDNHYTLTLPSYPWCMTTLQDGSLYVVCHDRSLQHVSYDGKQYKTVTTKELKKLKYPWISYNGRQNKLVTMSNLDEKFNFFSEK